MLATIDFRVRSPGLFGVAAGALDDVRAIKPAFQMSAARLAFIVLLITGALARLFNFDFMMRKLRRSLGFRSGDLASSQLHILSSAARRRRIRAYKPIVLEAKRRTKASCGVENQGLEPLRRRPASLPKIPSLLSPGPHLPGQP